MQLKKKRVLVIFLVIVISTGAFFLKSVVHQYGIHQEISGVSYAATPTGKSTEAEKPPEWPFYYPAPKQGPSEIFRKKEIEYPFTFIVYGDSREPAGYEKDALISKMIREKPDFILHTGDIVLYGEEHQWQIFDLFEGAIIDSGIPLYPVLGNHEYHTREKRYPPDPEKQLQCYFKRFKFLKGRRWYSFVYGNSLFLILDTVTDCSPRSYQYKWLMNRLKSESPTFLFISFHHPPYTKGGHISRESERTLANIFETYNKKGLIKADIVFSGHVHNYQRYRYNGINYVVSGGGGAPQHFINRSPNDFYTKSGTAFHYCKITVSENKATFEMIKLDENLGNWVVSDTFTISK